MIFLATRKRIVWSGFTTVSANRVSPHNYKPAIRYVANVQSGWFFGYNVSKYPPYTSYKYWSGFRGNILSIFHGGRQLHFFKKSSIRLPVSWNISITTKKRNHLYSWTPTVIDICNGLPATIRNEQALLSATLLPFVKSCWFQFPFPKPGVSPIVMTARDLIY